jgi:CubicO group peptidase (beta-lactamase class C family)
LAAALTAVLALGAIPFGGASATTTTTLKIHFHTTISDTTGDNITAETLAGAPGVLVEAATDSFGKVWTFEFTDVAADAYLGFTNAEDSLYPTDKRFVRAAGSTLEVWLIDGDPRVFGQPVEVPATGVTTHGSDGKAYIDVRALTTYIPGITYAQGTNGYVWRGNAARTLNILTAYYKGNWFEIAVDRDELVVNATGYTAAVAYWPYLYHNLPGFRGVGAYEYYLPFDWVDRLFSVGTLVIGGATGDSHLFLPPLDVAYDQIMPAATPESVGYDSVALAAADTYLQSLVDSGTTDVTPPWASMTLNLTRHGKVVFEKAYGHNKQYATTSGSDAALLPSAQWEATTLDTLFDLASNSKMYATNYAIQKLVSDGLLNIDTKLKDIPGFSCYDDSSNVYSGKWTGSAAAGVGKANVTIRDLLTHVAGQIPDPEYPNFTSAGAGLWYQTTQHTDRSGIIAAICATPLASNWRTSQVYSDVDYMALGLVVEAITGKTLDEYMDDVFYAPLGLTSTTFNPLENGFAATDVAATEINGNTRDGLVSFGQNPPGTAVPIRNYTLQGEVHDEKAYYSMDGVAGHAGLFSTVADLTVLEQIMLNGGVYDGQQFWTRSTQDLFTTYSGWNSYALGWKLQRSDYANAGHSYFQVGPARGSYGHDGWTGTMTVIDPYWDTSVNILTSRIHSPSRGTSTTTFMTSNNILTSRVIQTGALYAAFRPDTIQYNPVVTVAAVGGAEVATGAAEADALAALPASTTVEDSLGVEHTVALNWSVLGYDPTAEGDYPATATFTLPKGVTQSSPATALTLSATLSVVNQISSVAPVSDALVAFGTPAAAALAELPASAVLTDTLGGTHDVALTWAFTDPYDRVVAGDYSAEASFTLPDGVEQSVPPAELTVEAKVTVAARVTPAVTAAAGQAPPGSDVAVSAVGFYPGETVTIEFRAAGVALPLGSAIADAAGEVSLTVEIPAGAAPAVGAIQASGAESGDAPQTPFEVSDPTNRLVSIAPVDGVTVAFGAAEADALAQLPATTTIQDTAGATHVVALTWAFTAPYQRTVAGDHPAEASFALPDGVEQSVPATPLNVSAAVTIADRIEPAATASAAKVKPGANATIALRGFFPGETVTVYYVVDGKPLALGSAQADANGEAALTVTAPAALAGTTGTLRAEGDVSGQAAISAWSVLAASATLPVTGSTTAWPMTWLALVAIGLGLAARGARRRLSRLTL